MTYRHGNAPLDPTPPADRPALALDSLRTFEVVARRLSFTAAASELGTTQPAISQQIKRLEAQLQVRLFDRVHRGILLTEAGRLLQEYVEAGLATLDEGVRLVTARPAHEVLQVATDFAFAAYWLLPRLPRFHARHPELDVSLVTSDRVPLPGPEIDITLGFGDGRFKHGEAWPLFREEVFPVCSPRLLQGRQPPLPATELGRWPLLHLKAAPNSHGFVNPRHLEEMWRDQFDWVYRELDYAVFPITIHPDVSGRPQVLLMLERLIEHIQGHAGVRFATMDEIADDFLRRQPRQR